MSDNILSFDQINLSLEIKNLFKNKEKTYDELIPLANKYINISKGDEKNLSHIHLMRAFAYYYKNDFKQAIFDLDHAVDNNYEYYQLKGMIYSNSKFDDYHQAAAIPFFDKAIELNRENDELYYQRALTYFSWGKYERAKDDLSIALELNPVSKTYFYQRGLAYFNINNYEQAIEDFNSAIKHGFSHNDISLLHNLATAYFRLKNYNEALVNIDKAIKQETANEALRNLKLDIVLSREKSYFENKETDLREKIELLEESLQDKEIINKTQAKLDKVTDLAEAFQERVKWHQYGKYTFLCGLVLTTLLMFYIYSKLYCGINIWDYISTSKQCSLSDVTIGKYILLVPFLFMEYFFLSNYLRNLRFEAFYHHKKTVVLSIEKLQLHYYNMENPDDKREFCQFLLEQYKELYIAPSFVDKKYLFVKHGISSMKVNSDDSIAKNT